MGSTRVSGEEPRFPKRKLLTGLRLHRQLVDLFCYAVFVNLRRARRFLVASESQRAPGAAALARECQSVLCAFDCEHEYRRLATPVISGLAEIIDLGFAFFPSAQSNFRFFQSHPRSHVRATPSGTRSTPTLNPIRSNAGSVSRWG